MERKQNKCSRNATIASDRNEVTVYLFVYQWSIKAHSL